MVANELPHLYVRVAVESHYVCTLYLISSNRGSTRDLNNNLTLGAISENAAGKKSLVFYSHSFILYQTEAYVKSPSSALFLDPVKTSDEKRVSSI